MPLMRTLFVWGLIVLASPLPAAIHGFIDQAGVAHIAPVARCALAVVHARHPAGSGTFGNGVFADNGNGAGATGVAA